MSNNKINKNNGAGQPTPPDPRLGQMGLLKEGGSIPIPSRSKPRPKPAPGATMRPPKGPKR